jgi:hypothetical protein
MTKEEPNTNMLRAQAAVLLSQARAQSLDIQRALGMASGSGPLHTRLAEVAAQIEGAASQLSQALSSSTFPLRAADLMTLEGVVASSETNALTSEAAAEGQATAAATVAANVASASAATRDDVQTLSRDVFQDHCFDPYLHFASPEDEADYRRRTAAMQAYVTKELALGTPAGNLNASGGMLSQMLAADAHGAGDSPDFLPKWNKLAGDAERERAALKAAGQSTAEYDRTVTAGVRGFLKDKHLSDADIDKRLAGNADPLEAVRSFLKTDGSSRSADNPIAPSAPTASSSSGVSLPRVEPGSTREAQLSLDFAALAAQSRAAGVQMSDTAETAPAHGLAIGKPTGKPGVGIGD